MKEAMKRSHLVRKLATEKSKKNAGAAIGATSYQALNRR